jgi:hypothetical protein
VPGHSGSKPRPKQDVNSRFIGKKSNRRNVVSQRLYNHQ